MKSTNQQDWRSERSEGLGISEVLNAVWGRKIVIVGIVVVLTLFSVSYALIREPAYTVEAVVQVSPQGELGNEEDVGTFMDEVVGAVATEDMLSQTARRAGYEGNLASFRSRLEVSSTDARNGEPGSLTVAFRSGDSDEAARTANAYASLFVEKVENLNDQRLAGGTLGAEATVLSAAVASRDGSWTRIALYGLGAVAAGVLAGGTAALALDGRVRSWRGPRDAELTLRVPVIGVIPEYESITQRRT